MSEASNTPIKPCAHPAVTALGGNRVKWVYCTREKGHAGVHSDGKGVTWPR